MSGNRCPRCTPADALILTRIAHAAKRHWRYPEAWIRLWSADLTVTAEFIESNAVYCVREVDALAGFYALSFENEGAELEHMWVDPPFMGRGLGRVLFDHAVDQARRAGCACLRIASDPNAETFYLKMGAVRVGDVAATPAGRTLPLLELRLR